MIYLGPLINCFNIVLYAHVYVIMIIKSLKNKKIYQVKKNYSN